MTLEPLEIPEFPHSSDDFSSSPSHSSQHGSFLYDPSGLSAAPRDGGDSSNHLERSGHGPRRDSLGGVNADVLDERLRGLSIRGLDSACCAAAAAPGQRVYDYENALAQRAPQKATKRQPHDDAGVQLHDLPNEILTHIFSHLPPGSHSSVALVSKRFWMLITTHHAWRIAFMRHFPGHTVMEPKMSDIEAGHRNESSFDTVRSETRYFPRLTLRATWRSEYLLRTRYLRSLARGKPGIPPDAASPGGVRSGRKLSAVLTYNSKLPWRITSIHAVFSNGNKPPRVIQGTAELGMATIGDPTTGKIEKWGIEDLYAASQLEDAFTGLVPYGLGSGPAAAPNVMDVSQSYGMICGEGFPGGRAYFRGVNEPRGRYLNTEAAVADTNPDIPRVPSGLDAICSVWIAKSSTVMSTTLAMCGVLTGSALGVVTAYSPGGGTNGSRYASGEVTARWVLSPGVPIISLKVDEGYCQARKSAKRIWAVALNALGEVYYLNEAPIGRLVRTIGQDAMRSAWHAGRTAYWHLVGDTRRVARTSEVENDALREGHCPRSSSIQMGLDQDQLVAEAREINKFLNHKPERFRKSFEGWDMQRRLEVDFANDDGKGAGEGIFVIDCGLGENRSARIRRFVRSVVFPQLVPSGVPLPITAPSTPSLFGAVEDVVVNQAPLAVEPQSPRSPPPTPMSPLLSAAAHDWTCSMLDLKNYGHSVLSATALDNSVTSLLTFFEDVMLNANAWADQATREIPGRRARYIVAGTNDGLVLVWNARDEKQKGKLQPIRIIQTESPAVTCVAASGLYLVHGGSDGLVQAWDPLSSDVEHVRTINARPRGRAPRHMMVMNPTLREADLTAVGAIYLDPDPTVLQGVVSFGAFLRSWSYSSSPGRLVGPKKHAHHAQHEEVDARLASRRQSSIFAGFIASEEAELSRENERQERERLRISKRFGALGDLTEEEAIVYAQMISEEEFHADEQKRASDSTVDAGVDSVSSWSENAFDTMTPDPSPAAAAAVAAAAGEPSSVAETPAAIASHQDDNDDEYEQQIQQAIRLSLMESMNDPPTAQSQHQTSPPPPGESGFTVKYKYPRSGGKKEKQQWTASTSLVNTHPYATTSTSGPGFGSAYHLASEEEELELALSLSLQDQQQEQSDAGWETVHHHHHHHHRQQQQQQYEIFPSLPGDGAGKGKGVQR